MVQVWSVGGLGGEEEKKRKSVSWEVEFVVTGCLLFWETC
jgi:hypothetical protein